jgi:hypothetical protein
MLRFAFLFYFMAWSGILAHDKHPIYLSLTELAYKPQQQRLEIAIKVFSDDMQMALSKKHGRVVEIGTDREDPQAAKLLFDYVQQHLKIQTLEGQTLRLMYVGRELEREDFFATWIYVQVEQVPSLKGLKIQNTILTEVLPQQNNVLTVRYQNQVKRFSLSKHQSSVELTW